MASLLSPSVAISPISAVLRGMFVEFKHFHTCCSPVGTVCNVTRAPVTPIFSNLSSLFRRD
jgi:hypothetical protein